MGSEDTKHTQADSYFDRNGRLVGRGVIGGAATEYAYDGIGRNYQSRTIEELSSAMPYSSGVFTYVAPTPEPGISVMTSGDDGVLELNHTGYEDNSNNVISRHRVEINHNDTNGISLTNGKPTGGVRHSTLMEYDTADRLTKSVDYGTGPDDATQSSWQTSDLPEPSSLPGTSLADRYLVTKYEYNSDTGRQEIMTDSAGIDTKTYYDDAGRRLFVVENYQTGYDPTSNPGGSVSDENRTTGWKYNATGQVTELTAYNGTTEEQTTKYFYNDDYNASLVTETIYPDSLDTDKTGTDQVKMTYHLDGSLDTRTDQRGVVMTYSYDDARRTTLQAATTIPSGIGVDDHVQAIGRSYDTLGRVSTITSYAGTTTSTTVRNQIEYTYDSNHGRLATSKQNHSGAVGTGTPAVEYSYDDDVDSNDVYTDGLRLESVTYPDGYVSYQEYGSSGDIDDLLGRVTALRETSATGTVLTGYDYNGTNRLVKTGYETTGSSGTVSMHADRNNDSVYGIWDRFGRVGTMHWTREVGSWSASELRDSVKYNYDLAGNRTARNVKHDLMTADAPGTDIRDQEYFYDDLHRLENYEQGDAHDSGASVNQINTLKFSQDWDLDQLGNWSGFDQDDDGDGTDELTQTRTHNKANELLTASSWASPAHDKAGNMTTIPKPDTPASSYTAKYDAWNRLVEIDDDGETSSYKYDGLHRRITRNEGGGEHIHFYYNTQWQVLEERFNNGNVKKKYVYHPHYVDAVAVQYSGTGTSTKHFYLHDALFNVTAIMEDDGDVLQRYSYTPYGEATVLKPDFSVETGTPFDNEYLYTGRRTDPEAGLQLNRNRYYHQHLGRWVNRDYFEYIDGYNLYQYISSYPLDYTDPYGYAKTLPWATAKPCGTFTISHASVKPKNRVDPIRGGGPFPGYRLTFDSTGCPKNFCKGNIKLVQVISSGGKYDLFGLPPHFDDGNKDPPKGTRFPGYCETGGPGKDDPKKPYFDDSPLGGSSPQFNLSVCAVCVSNKSGKEEILGCVTFQFDNPQPGNNPTLQTVKPSKPMPDPGKGKSLTCPATRCKERDWERAEDAWKEDQQKKGQ